RFLNEEVSQHGSIPARLESRYSRLESLKRYCPHQRLARCSMYRSGEVKAGLDSNFPVFRAGCNSERSCFWIFTAPKPEGHICRAPLPELRRLEIVMDRSPSSSTYVGDHQAVRVSNERSGLQILFDT